MNALAIQNWLGGAGLLMGITIGVAAGVSLFTFHYAEGTSYLGKDPAACANCHVMDDHYDAWLKSSHRNVAGCNDCHTPDGFFSKNLVKAVNGWNHSVAFTTGDFHEPIQIKPWNQAITEETCRSCHSDVVHAIDVRRPGDEAMSCVRCHDSVGHMR